MVGRIVAGLDAAVGLVVRAARWLALPVILLLFLQWPLRDWVRCCSREANDLGQWLFALFIAVSITAATRAGVHLAAETGAHPTSRLRIVAGVGGALILLSWSAFLLLMSAPQVLASLNALERFPDTSNPAYFVVKLALWLLAGLVAAQAIVDLYRLVKRP